jgi:thioredoxin reductase (NADPH)
VNLNEERLAETPDVGGAYPRLSKEQIELLSRRGEQRPVQRGDLLVAEGQRDRDFVVVLSGKIAVIEGHGTPKAQTVRIHGPRRFLDELGLLTGQPSFVSMVVQEPGRVLAVPLPGLHELVREEPDLGDLILRSFLARRELLIGGITGIKIVGSRFSPDTRRGRVRRQPGWPGRRAPAPAMGTAAPPPARPGRGGCAAWRPNRIPGPGTQPGRMNGRVHLRWVSRRHLRPP